MLVIILTALALNGAVVVAGLALWLGVRSRRGASERQLERLAAQVESLRGTLDAVALEMERLGEGQRYAARLLGERVTGATAAAPRTPTAGVVTPH